MADVSKHGYDPGRRLTMGERIAQERQSAIEGGENGKLLDLECSAHGRLWIEAVWCGHDTKRVTDAVLTAHHAEYGANCTDAVVTVSLLDPETLGLTLDG